MSGATWLNSLATTVATPAKWPGRTAPQKPSLNPATETGAGFEVDTNRVTLITRDAEEALPLQSKDEVAETILDRVALLLERLG